MNILIPKIDFSVDLPLSDCRALWKKWHKLFKDNIAPADSPRLYIEMHIRGQGIIQGIIGEWVQIAAKQKATACDSGLPKRRYCYEKINRR